MSSSVASQVFRELDRELWVITAEGASRRGGMVATFVCQASLPAELPRVIVGVAKHHHTWALIEESRVFGLHLLGEDQVEWAWRFGIQSGRDVDKLEDMPYRMTANRCPILEGVPAWLECRIETQLDTGDRSLYLAEIVDAGRVEGRTPLRVHQILSLANDEQRAELTAQMKRDGAIDAAAIRAWRDLQLKE